MKKCPLFAVIVLQVGFSAIAFAQGPLTPPGPPGPTMRTLDQIEPRTPINSLPFSINQPGSYYLTTNLTGASGQSGITVAAHRVTIDLNGFELAGVAGAVSGIQVLGMRTNLVVRNGWVHGWPVSGINASNANASHFERVQSLHNGAGILAGGSSILESCAAGFNAGVGIRARQGSLVRNCSAFSNGAFGIGLGSGVIEGCAARANRGNGIQAGEQTQITACSASTNAGNGIVLTNDGVIRNCVAARNALNGIVGEDTVIITHCTASLNGSNGIVAIIGCGISDCIANLNSLDGISLGSRCRIVGNNATDNGEYEFVGAGFFVSGDDNFLEGNNSVHNFDGYLILGEFNFVVKNKASFSFNVGFETGPNNRVGPVLGTPTVTNANAWANFAY
ncbi:MAG: right-handed parallel beta-helix repeat-containing protein [Verrucomicrobia subdivision 3 bacterium]|nr:right-handed parallel beta-helix repeat-containing protein [Limisphaerales bacterium]